MIAYRAKVITISSGIKMTQYTRIYAPNRLTALVLLIERIEGIGYELSTDGLIPNKNGAHISGVVACEA